MAATPGKRVLLVEDDADNRDATAQLLEVWGYEVVAAESGSIGVKAFAAGPFDLVVTDLDLPDMNGWEVATAIKTASARTPVALMTGWGDSLDGVDSHLRNVDLIVKKPVDPRRFQAAVAKLIG